MDSLFQQWIDSPVPMNLSPAREMSAEAQKSAVKAPIANTEPKTKAVKRKAPAKSNKSSGDEEDRKEKRRKQNRDAAATSRMRKKQHMETLERKVNDLMKLNRELQQSLALLQAENKALHQQAAVLSSQQTQPQQQQQAAPLTVQVEAASAPRVQPKVVPVVQANTFESAVLKPISQQSRVFSRIISHPSLRSGLQLLLTLLVLSLAITRPAPVKSTVSPSPSSWAPRPPLPHGATTPSLPSQTASQPHSRMGSHQERLHFRSRIPAPSTSGLGSQPPLTTAGWIASSTNSRLRRDPGHSPAARRRRFGATSSSPNAPAPAPHSDDRQLHATRDSSPSADRPAPLWSAADDYGLPKRSPLQSTWRATARPVLSLLSRVFGIGFVYFCFVSSVVYV